MPNQSTVLILSPKDKHYFPKEKAQKTLLKNTVWEFTEGLIQIKRFILQKKKKKKMRNSEISVMCVSDLTMYHINKRSSPMKLWPA